jgi:hypothetical protein
LSDWGLCDELITHPEVSYRLCCVVVCDLEASRIGAPYIYDISNLRVKHEVQKLCFLPTENLYVIVWFSEEAKIIARYITNWYFCNVKREREGVFISQDEMNH